MPVEIHENCLNRLKQTLIQAMDQFGVVNGSYLDFMTISALQECENVLPKKGQLIDTLKNYIDDTPFSTFVEEVINRDLAENEQYTANTHVKINEIPRYADTKSAAEALVNAFAKLPLTYNYTLPLSPELSALLPDELSHYELSSTIRLSRVNESFRENFPLSSGDTQKDQRIHQVSILAMFAPTFTSWPDDIICIHHKDTGFAGHFNKLTPDLNAEATFKSILGIGIAIGLFDFRFKYRAIESKDYYYVHSKRGESWKIGRKRQVEQSVQDGLPHIRLDPGLADFPTVEQLRNWKLHLLRKLRDSFTGDEAGRRIRLAGQWLFDSYTGRNELLNFVQAMVCLEILFGEEEPSNVIGLSALLRNRCAYLIGRSHKDRESILKEFQEMYSVRSKIVHTGKTKFTRNERFMLFRLRQICSQAIAAEIGLVNDRSLSALGRILT